MYYAILFKIFKFYLYFMIFDESISKGDLLS